MRGPGVSSQSGKDLLIPIAAEPGTSEQAGMDIAVYVSAIARNAGDEEVASPIEAPTEHASPASLLPESEPRYQSAAAKHDGARVGNAPDRCV